MENRTCILWIMSNSLQNLVLLYRTSRIALDLLKQKRDEIIRELDKASADRPWAV
jgi:hypothetical protein